MDLPAVVTAAALALAAWLVVATVIAVAVGSTIRLRDSFRAIPQESTRDEFAKGRSAFDVF
jgi:hypothetical protein